MRLTQQEVDDISVLATQLAAEDFGDHDDHSKPPEITPGVVSCVIRALEIKAERFF